MTDRHKHEYRTRGPDALCYKCGAPRQRTRETPCPDIARLRQLAEQRMSPVEIGKQFQVGRKVVWRWMKENCIARITDRRIPGVFRGQANPTYSSWAAMRTRVTNRNRHNSHRYVGRGIDCDPRWTDFDNFLRDMGTRPAGMTLDRIDNDRGYWPDNCRWADRRLQVHNSSRIFKIVTFRGKEMQVGQVLDALGATWEDYKRARPRRGSTPQIAVDRLVAKLGRNK